MLNLEMYTPELVISTTNMSNLAKNWLQLLINDTTDFCIVSGQDSVVLGAILINYTT